MNLNKIFKNAFLIVLVGFVLSACATKTKQLGSQIQGDVYTGTDTVEYLASGVPDRVVFCNKWVSINYCFKRNIEKTSCMVKKKSKY